MILPLFVDCAWFHLHPRDLLVQPFRCLAIVNELGERMLETCCCQCTWGGLPLHPHCFALLCLFWRSRGSQAKLLVSLCGCVFGLVNFLFTSLYPQVFSSFFFPSFLISFNFLFLFLLVLLGLFYSCNNVYIMRHL